LTAGTARLRQSRGRCYASHRQGIYRKDTFNDKMLQGAFRLCVFIRILLSAFFPLSLSEKAATRFFFRLPSRADASKIFYIVN
jgi:hypothetical protein